MEIHSRLTRWSRANPFALDVALTLVLAAIVVPWSTGMHLLADATHESPERVWALLLVAPLPWRRTRPVASAVAVFAVAAAHTVAGPWLVLPADLLVLVALHSVTLHGPRWAGRTAMAAVLLGTVISMGRVAYVAGPPYLLTEALTFAGMMSVTGFAVWAFALLRRSRRETLIALHDRAEQLERERDQQSQLAAAAERARIAREMHDVVAHSLSVVVAQADGGRYAAARDPDAATRALATIADTGRAALADVRRILGVLRTEPEPQLPVPDVGAPPQTSPHRVPEPQLDLAPQPTAGDLGTLVEQVRTAGLEVAARELGEPRPLPPGMALTVYRICQEALTNVLRHAGPNASVTLLRRWEPRALVLEIGDDGRGASAHDDGAGHGLVGMRERVALFDGTFVAGPGRSGGFDVRAELPLPAESAAARPAEQGNAR